MHGNTYIHAVKGMKNKGQDWNSKLYILFEVIYLVKILMIRQDKKSII